MTIRYTALGKMIELFLNKKAEIYGTMRHLASYGRGALKGSGAIRIHPKQKG